MSITVGVGLDICNFIIDKFYVSNMIVTFGNDKISVVTRKVDLDLIRSINMYFDFEFVLDNVVLQVIDE